MKAISLWQPWATLVAVGAKEIETRSWPTSHRGPLLIHAAKRQSKSELEELLEYPEFERALEFYRTPEDSRLTVDHILDLMPFGAIVGKVEMVDCVKTEDLRETISRSEYMFGNYGAGRFGWVFEKSVDYPFVPYKGEQGLFNIPDELVESCLFKTEECSGCENVFLNRPYVYDRKCNDCQAAKVY